MNGAANLTSDSVAHDSRKCFAFFDVDETIISLKSMFDFFPFWCGRKNDQKLCRRFQAAFAQARAEGLSREELNRLYYRFFHGVSLQVLEVAGREWFEDRFCVSRPPYIEHVVAQLKVHQRSGDIPVFVSGSMLPLLEPLARALNVEHCLCTKLQVDTDGRLTGEIDLPQTIGQGKVEAIASFLQQENGLAQNCFGYGDDISDSPMLEAVGNAVAIGDDGELIALASVRGWKRLPA
ncbi:HAD family hydrolase [Pseudomonas sp. CR3202]|uniref:HAD family hydrolase n=1 Tax=Pseudomonas sp. CR3202 TaxID=3351532 RepID=UPI003BF3B7C4